MDNFIEESINYLYYNGGFDLNTGYQKFAFRIRPNGIIEVKSTSNHITNTYTGEPDIYQFFAFLIFCDLFSSVQKTTISLCTDKNVSLKNLKALNRVYIIYKNMLSLNGERLADAISDEDPGALDRIMLAESYDVIPTDFSHLKFDVLKARIETDTYYFARKFEYFDYIYELLLTTEDYEMIHEYAALRWEELNNNIEKENPNYFTKREALEILFNMTSKLERELEIEFASSEEEKHFILNTLIRLYDYKIDIIDIVYYIHWAFTLSCSDEKDRVSINEIITALELSYLSDNIKSELLSKLKSKVKKESNNELAPIIMLCKRD